VSALKLNVNDALPFIGLHTAYLHIWCTGVP